MDCMQLFHSSYILKCIGCYRVIYNVIFSKPSMCIAKAQLQKCKVIVALL